MPEYKSVQLPANQLLQLPGNRRGQSLLEAVSFRPASLGDFDYAIGELRNSFA